VDLCRICGARFIVGRSWVVHVVSYAVAQRTNEFGIRMALGAPRRHVLRIAFISPLASLTVGILIGAALTFALNRIVAR